MPVLGGIQETVHEALDLGTEPFHHARSECLVHEATEPCMVRRIAIQHGEATRWAGDAEARGDVGPDGLLAEPWIPERRHHVVVPGQDPEAEGTLMDGILGLEPVVGRIGIVDEVRIHRIEPHLGHLKSPWGRSVAYLERYHGTA